MQREIFKKSKPCKKRYSPQQGTYDLILKQTGHATKLTSTAKVGCSLKTFTNISPTINSFLNELNTKSMPADGSNSSCVLRQVETFFAQS